MTRITVQGLGLLGGFGHGAAALAQALAAGQSPRSFLQVPTGAGPVALSALRADPGPLQELISPMVLRRMDHLTRMGLFGARLALADAGLEPSGHPAMGLVLASGHGATATTYALLDSIINDGDACASPTHFASSLHSACAGTIAISLGLTGPSLTVSQGDLSVPSALLTARQWLLDGRVERVLFGALDELSELTGSLWPRQGRAADPAAVPGEGAAFLVLSRAAESRPGYCELEAVSTGRGLERGELKAAGAGLLLVSAGAGADRLAEGAALAGGCPTGCFTPLYGSMPAGPGFDLAIGAMMLRAGRSFPSPGATGAAPGPEHLGRLACLTLAEEAGYGLATLSSLHP